MDRDTVTFTQMGGEGATWIGQAPFTDDEARVPEPRRRHLRPLRHPRDPRGRRGRREHDLQDPVQRRRRDDRRPAGRRARSRSRASRSSSRPRACAGSMVVTDEPEKYTARVLPAGVTVHHRRTLERVQRELREVPGVSALIYDQTCAAELHRKRKRGTIAAPDKRVVINELVCEGCGDCNVQSNCLSVMPLETEFGRKRRINQSSCNQDFSCLEGFCPSFVTLRGAQAQSAAAAGVGGVCRACPSRAPGRERRRAQHSDRGRRRHGRRDRERLARPRGAPRRQARRAARSDRPRAEIRRRVVARSNLDGPRAAARHADPGGAGGSPARLPTSSSRRAASRLSMLSAERSPVIVNVHEEMPPSFIRERDFDSPARKLIEALRTASRRRRRRDPRGTRLASALLGDSIGANVLMLGFAFQTGAAARIGRGALSRARALRPQRRGEQARVRLGPIRRAEPRASRASGDGRGRRRDSGRRRAAEASRSREEFLIGYQNRAYAARYRTLVDRVAAAEQRVRPGSSSLHDAVARNYFCAARLQGRVRGRASAHRDRFPRRAYGEISARERVRHSTSLRRCSRESIRRRAGRRNTSSEPGCCRVLRVLAKLEVLRGTKLDPFGYGGRSAARARVARAL